MSGGQKDMAKQKLKTNKAAAKRVKISGSGKAMRRKVAIGALRRNKSHTARRAADKMFPLSKGDRRRLKRLLPYAW
jgi:large subunit ribosomal protein L35